MATKGSKTPKNKTSNPRKSSSKKTKESNLASKIKELNDNGNGLSVRAIAKELSLSRNTVKKYLRMNEEQIGLGLANRDRPKQLDRYFTYIKHLYQSYKIFIYS